MNDKHGSVRQPYIASSIFGSDGCIEEEDEDEHVDVHWLSTPKGYSIFNRGRDHI
jgi:hypothetical protein